MCNFKEFDLIEKHKITFCIYQEPRDSDVIIISLNSLEDLWNGGRNTNNTKFCNTIYLNRDEWVKAQGYIEDEYIKYQKDFQDALDEFLLINMASEIKTKIGVYLIQSALNSIKSGDK